MSTERRNPAPPPIRAEPSTPDNFDAERLTLVRKRWTAQDAACMERDRQVELAVRMLAGRQWDIWSPKRGRFVDPSQYMDENERRWRQRPVVDFLGWGHQLNVAKLTESPPVVSFEPSTADHADATLAEVCDTIFKTIAYDAGMDDKRARYMSWAYAAGECYLKSRVDYNVGDEKELAGPAVLSMEGGDGGTIERYADRVPYGQDGSPVAQLEDDGSSYSVPQDFTPITQKEGAIRVDVLCPLEIRREWSDKPLEEARWIIHRTFLTPDEVLERYGVECAADVTGSESSAGGYLERLKFAAGHFMGVYSRPTLGGAGESGIAPGDGYVCVDEMWEKPCPAYPQGRLLCVTKDKVLHDSRRPYDTEGAGPFRHIAALRQPGRMFPSTPFEKAIPIQKGINRLYAQILEHTTKCANPIKLIDDRAGIDPGDVTNESGLQLMHHAPSGVVPMQYVAPAALGSDVWQVLGKLEQQLLAILSIPGSEGRAPTTDASGELVEQLRYNADRSISSIAHDSVRAEAGLARDWLAILPTIWTDEKLLSYAGEDGVMRTVTVLPEMFDGSVNVRPIMDSALPETRGERAQRVLNDYQLGIFGMPGSPQANDWYLSQMRYPNLNRASRPGGPDRLSAEKAIGEITRGSQAVEIPLLKQYDFGVWKMTLRNFIASPDYLGLDEATQQQLQLLDEAVAGAFVAQQMEQQAVMGQMQMATVAQAAQQQTQMQQLIPPPPEPNPAGPNGPPGSTNKPPAASKGAQAA